LNYLLVSFNDNTSFGTQKILLLVEQEEKKAKIIEQILILKEMNRNNVNQSKFHSIPL
jgi:hypothetical protein